MTKQQQQQNVQKQTQNYGVAQEVWKSTCGTIGSGYLTYSTPLAFPNTNKAELWYCKSLLGFSPSWSTSNECQNCRIAFAKVWVTFLCFLPRFSAMNFVRPLKSTQWDICAAAVIFQIRSYSPNQKNKSEQGRQSNNQAACSHIQQINKINLLIRMTINFTSDKEHK